MSDSTRRGWRQGRSWRVWQRQAGANDSGSPLGAGPAPPTRRLPDYALESAAYNRGHGRATRARPVRILQELAMNDDYDYRATFDFSQAD
jgi:hypothetical protein